MSAPFTRRQFLQATTAVAGVALAPRWATAAPASGTAPAGRQPFAFPLLGDLHYDKLEHHDMAWVEKDKPNDVGQIHNYTRIAREVSPQLFARVRETVAELNRNPRTRVPFVLQAGDLVEGLCGSEELSVRQNSEALAFVRDAQLGAPVLFTKGNHDVTGPGSVEAFGHVFHPFLTEQARAVAPASAEVKSGQKT